MLQDNMTSEMIADIINLELEAQEQWPQLINLYCPHEVEQILLPDNANCLAVHAFLLMCDLKFQIEPRTNAEYMSPNGSIPFIKCGAFVLSEFDNIVSFIASKGTNLSSHLKPEDKSDMKAYISLVNNIFVNAELYICWVDQATLEVTKKRHGSVYPWPLNHYLNWQKRKQVIKKLNVLGWYNRTLEEVCKEVEECCIVLSGRLSESKYFFGDKPVEIDALVYGHIRALTFFHSLPSAKGINKIIHSFPLFIEHHNRIHNIYFKSKIKPNIEEALTDDSTIRDFEIIETPSKEDFLWDDSDTIESLPPLSEDNPNELDALVFGHIFTILTTPLPNDILANIVHNFPTLVKHCTRIETRYFKSSDDSIRLHSNFKYVPLSYTDSNTIKFLCYAKDVSKSENIRKNICNLQ